MVNWTKRMYIEEWKKHENTARNKYWKLQHSVGYKSKKFMKTLVMIQHNMDEI